VGGLLSQPDLPGTLQGNLTPATLASLRSIAANPSLSLTTAANQINAILEPYSIVVTFGDVQVYRDVRFADYFLNSRASVVQLETLELTHPAFSQAYRVVRNATAGITVKLETGATANFEYYPLKIMPHHARDDLDHYITITFGDLGEVLPIELDNMMKYPNGMSIKPVIKYRVYRSDDLQLPLYGPLTLEADAFTFDKEGATFDAKAPSLNNNRTGEVYSMTRFPMMRAFT
jgi:hypothetical protein